MNFPHIKDTNFPYLENVNAFQYQNNFDYSRWKGKVALKLCNVLWNSNYADVPGFTSDVARDKYFDEISGIVQELESGFNVTPENSTRVPIPYNDAYRFNYLVVDMPIKTSEEMPIDYEDNATRVKRWYYFIDSMTELSPNATELYITLDVWTTFINTVDIPYLMLERGHAPMMQIDVETFLSNPIMNNEYLLADDFNYGNDTVIQTSVYKPIGNGTKYVLFCAPYRWPDFVSFGGTQWNGNPTPPSYEDENNRWGYQLTVNDYEWKYGNSDYREANLPITNMLQTGILNGCDCFAIEGTQAYDFFNECAKYCAHMLHGIKAMFILDESLFTKSYEFTFRGYTLYVADKKVNYENFEFTKEEFGFDSKYSKITKLYTSPYSTLEITDDEGNIFSAKIENCGNVKMREEVSLVYPYLNYNIFFSGINGDGEMSYIWKTTQGYTEDKAMWASDFSKFMMNWDVPTYELFISAENEYATNHAADMMTKRAGAIKDYRNGVRYANTTKENVTDSMQTNTNNVAASGATNTANVGRSGQTNTDNVGRSGQTNTDNVGRSGQTNTDNVADSMGLLIINTANDSASNSDITHNNNEHNQYTANQAVAKIYADYASDNAVTAAGIDATATNMMASGVSNGISALGSAASSGFSPGGVAMAGIGFIGAEVTSVVAAGMNVNIANAASQASLEKAEHGEDYIQNVNQDLQSTNSANVTRRNNCNMDNANNTKNCNNGNAARTQSTNNTNASASQTTNNTNASASQITNNTNASASQSTNNANAARTQNTETNNANWTRNATVAAEKANLVQKQLEAANSYKNARLQVPHEQGRYAGDFAPDVYQRRGIRFNIRTQSKSAIAQAGDAMLRFGYALHRVWNMSNGFHYGKHFTFWKAEDIWINEGNGLAGNAVNIIGDILLKGVTVWRNADEIGKVNIYDNI